MQSGQALRIAALRAIDCRKYHDTWRLGDAERQNVADDSILCKRFHETPLSKAFGRRQAQHSITAEQPCVAHVGLSSNQLHEMLPCAAFRRCRGSHAMRIMTFRATDCSKFPCAIPPQNARISRPTDKRIKSTRLDKQH